MREVAPDPDPSAGGAIARLERRVQVMERAFSDIVERHEKSLRDRGEALAAIENSIAVVGRRLQQSEERSADAVAELRTAIAEASMRINMLEVADPAGTAAPVPPLATAIPVADAGNDPGAIAVSKPADAESSKAQPEDNYLSAARRAAMAQQGDNGPRTKESVPARKNRTRLFIVGCIAPAIIGATALFVLNRHTVTAEPVHSQGSETRKMEAAAPPALTPAAETASRLSTEELALMATAGDARAARDLGLRYLAGTGAALDPAEAASWLLRASYAGDAAAQYWLATLYAQGKGVPVDAEQASHWFETAARNGNVRAMHSLALADLEGWGREKNLPEAARWFTKAAELGFVDSEFNLGILYERGLGVPQSLGDAYRWYAIAAAAGDAEAKARLSLLKPALSPAELALAQSAAAAAQKATADGGILAGPRS